MGFDMRVDPKIWAKKANEITEKESKNKENDFKTNKESVKKIRTEKQIVLIFCQGGVIF